MYVLVDPRIDFENGGKADGRSRVAAPLATPAPRGRGTFAANQRGRYWSLCVFAILFGLSLFAEFVANDKPILVQYRGEYYTPIFKFYPETAFGGDFQTEAVYRDPEVQCLIASGGWISVSTIPRGDRGRRRRRG